jgi:hypothetical protein
VALACGDGVGGGAYCPPATFTRNPQLRSKIYENPLIWIAINNRDPIFYNKSLTWIVIIYNKPLIWIAINNRDPIFDINTPGVFQISPSSSSSGLPRPRRDDPPTQAAAAPAPLAQCRRKLKPIASPSNLIANSSLARPT